MEMWYPAAHNNLHTKRENNCEKGSKGSVSSFTEGDFVSGAREEFASAEIFLLRWRGPRCIVRAVSYFVYKVKDLRNGFTEDMHAARLKQYHELQLDAKEIMPHVLFSEIGVEVQRLIFRHDISNGLMVQVCQRELPSYSDTDEPLRKWFEDVFKLLMNF